MFDISWTEFLLIGVVALIFIGPKELPAVLRTLGQWTRRIRSMAADFQNQFQEAMREAEMADLKKQVDDIAHDIKSYDPLKDVRADVEAAGKDIQSSLEKPAESAAETATAQSETAGIDRCDGHGDWPGRAGSCRGVGGAGRACGHRACDRLFARSRRRRGRDRSGRAGGSRKRVEARHGGA